MPSQYDDDLEDIELGHDPRTRLAEPELSPINEESSSWGSSTHSNNQPSLNDAEISSDEEPSSDAQAPNGRRRRLPDTAYPALPPTNWTSRTPFLVRDQELGRGTSPETFAESFQPDQEQSSQEQSVEDQVHDEYNQYLMSANAFAERWEKSPQTPPWLATVEEDLARHLTGPARPSSPRDYWEDAGPVRREHFAEYKDRKEQNERNLTKLFFRAGRKMQDLQHEVRLKNDEIDGLEQVVVALQARVIRLEALGIREHKLAEHADSRTPRTPLGKVYRNDYSSRHERAALADLPSTRRFLYDDVFSQHVELVVEVALQRADIQWRLRDWDRMWSTASYAHGWAKDLQYKPLLQRCHFYLGVAAFGRGELAAAAESFEWAAGCRDCYPEGELVGDWHIRTKREIRRRRRDAESREPELEEADREDGGESSESGGLDSATGDDSGYAEEEEDGVKW
ncbi:hypothetical protein MMC11_004970 [Xylographa trunciseda]|nr:hypothetical protein [Xylographa trunciseda]